MHSLRIPIVAAGVTTRKGGQDQPNRGILDIDPGDIECVWTAQKDRTGLRTRSGAEFVVDQNFEHFLVWFNGEVRLLEERKERELP